MECSAVNAAPSARRLANSSRHATTRRLVLIGGFLLAALAATEASANAVRVMEVRPGRMPEFEVQLTAGQMTTFVSSPLTAGVDPVLHLWDPVTDSELAMDDNGGGGRSARLRVRAPRTGTYLLIVRPRGFSSGEVTVTHDGVTMPSGATLRPGFQPLVTLRPREEVITLSAPGGPLEHTIYLLADDGMRIEKRMAGLSRTRWVVPQNHWGARTLMVATKTDSAPPVRVLRNDVALDGADPDRDGLGAGLERQLKTCSVATDSFGAFTCNQVTDLRDTDSDGISDGWEVLGRDHGDVYVALPYWGSDPRHKDIFIEVDYRRLTEVENVAGVEEKMPVEVALKFAGLFSDATTTDPLIQLHHATLAGNPDQKPGINVHLDIGRAPERPEHATIYGDWGGYDALDAVQDANGNWQGVNIASVWKTNMHNSRRGIFRYGPGHKEGGGQCEPSIACGFNFNDVHNTIHETMHGLDINHSGPWDADRIASNCKPNWPSIANYGYGDQLRLSDGRNRPLLNNTRLPEWKAVPVNECPVEVERDPNRMQRPALERVCSATQYLTDLQELFRYRVDVREGHVDWDRDGVFAPSGQKVRAYANHRPNESCEFTRQNRAVFRDIDPVALAITRVGHHTLVFDLSRQGVLQYRDSVSDWQCPPADEGCPGSSFGEPVTLPFGRVLRSFDAEAVKIDGAYQVAIVAIDDRGLLRERRLHLQPDGTLKLDQTTRTIRTGRPVAGDPSLSATRGGTTLFLAYKHFDNKLFWNSRATAFWESERVAANGPGVPLTTTQDASPALAGGYAFGTGNEVMYLVHLQDGTLKLSTFDKVQGRWPNTRLAPMSGGFNYSGRPALEWVPSQLGSETPGQLYLGYRGGGNMYRMSRSYYDIAQRQVRFGLDSVFDNIWLTGNAFDWVASGAGSHPQLWAVLHFKNAALGSHMQFRPRADGILDVDMRNHDDWSALAWAACHHVVNPGNLVSNPIRCPSRPW